jgi:hypothetical protein
MTAFYAKLSSPASSCYPSRKSSSLKEPVVAGYPDRNVAGDFGTRGPSDPRHGPRVCFSLPSAMKHVWGSPNFDFSKKIWIISHLVETNMDYLSEKLL